MTPSQGPSLDGTASTLNYSVHHYHQNKLLKNRDYLFIIAHLLIQPHPCKLFAGTYLLNDWYVTSLISFHSLKYVHPTG